MKPYIQLVIKKQWFAYFIFILTIMLALGALWIAHKSASQTFKIPIAVQDMSHSKASKQLIHQMDSSPYVEIQYLPKDDFYIDDLVKKKEVMVSLQIPKDFNSKLKNNNLKSSIPLYGRDDFIGSIAVEIVSRSLYEQQIPYIIQEHLDDMNQTKSHSDIQNQYYKDTPKSQLTTHSITQNANQSISIGVVFACVIMVSAIQILLHQRLKQNAPLQRLFLTNHSQLKLYSTYVVTHVFILIIILIGISLVIHQPLSIFFYLKSLIILVIYELGIALLLFKINVLSHRIFMAIVYAIVMSVIYLWIQL